MSREAHVRFWERAGVRLLRATRLPLYRQNFGFLGASALVLECHRPEERTRVQALNDFLVFGMMVVATFASGGLLTGYGWAMVCWIAFPLLVFAWLALLLPAGRRVTTAALDV
jgi:MFS family permease